MHEDPQRLPRWVVPALIAGLLLLWIGGPLLLWLLLRGPRLPAAVEELLARHPPSAPATARAVEQRAADGRLLQRGQALRRDDGAELRVGRWESYGERDELIGLGSFDAAGSGFHARWDEAGRLLWIHDYRAGVECRYRSYHRNGKLAQDQHRDVSGALDGPYRAWYEDGTLRFDGRHRAGARIGTWLYRRTDGSKQIEEDYADGVLRAKRRFVPDDDGAPIAHGRWTRWNADGEVIETRWFEHGRASAAPTDAPRQPDASEPLADEPASVSVRRSER